MIQWLRVLALPDNKGLIPSTCMLGHNHPIWSKTILALNDMLHSYTSKWCIHIQKLNNNSKESLSGVLQWNS